MTVQQNRFQGTSSISEIILENNIDLSNLPTSGYFEVYQTATLTAYVKPGVTPTEQSKITGINLISGTDSGTLTPNIYLVITGIQWGTMKGVSNTQDPTQLKYLTAPTFTARKYTANSKTYYFAEIATGQIGAKVCLKNSGTNASLNIRDLRTAAALQRYQEKSLKYGAEYEDYVKMEFGISPRDSRLQKSEYLGGSQTILQISEVIQTTDATDSPLGNQGGYSIGTAKSRKIKYQCPEHGIIIGLCSIRPETIYTQGIDRDLLKTERFEFWTREMVGIGAQEIKQQEIYATAENKDQIFGYDLNGNYREYYSKRSRVSGNFRTDLNFWHLGRFFENPPALNNTFLTMNPRKDIFAITDQTLPAFLCYFQNSALFYRPIPSKIKNKIT